MEGGKYFTVFRYHLSGELAVGVLEILKRRNVCKGPYCTDEQEDCSRSGSEKNPEPSYYPLFRYVCHICKDQIPIIKCHL